LHAGGASAELLNRSVELVLTAAADKDVSTLGDEPLRRREADAAVAASDECDLSCESL